MKMSRHILALALAVLSLCACTSMSSRDPLQVMVAGIEPLQGEGLELRFLVKLRVQNPNGTPFDYAGAYVKLEVQDRTFATGVSDAGGTVTGFGESLVDVPVTVSVLRIARQVIGMRGDAPAEQIRYKMSGKLGSHRFSADGEFSMKPPAPAAPAETN